MNITIIVSEGDDNELLRGEYSTFESAEEGLEKLRNEFEKKQTEADDAWKNQPGADGEPY
jgi:hypothetical protein